MATGQQGTTKPLVGVVIGSRADFNIVRRGLEALRVMGVPYVFELASVHRSPDRLCKFAQNASAEGIEVLICASGGSASLAGILATYSNLPVIAVPIDSTPLRGQDALYSMVQTPPGLPIATVGINNSENAALLATQILSLKYGKYRQVLQHRRQSLLVKQETSLNELAREYPDLCDPAKTAPLYSSPGYRSSTDEDTDPGSDEATPDPGPEKAERIRPGAMLNARAEAPGGILPPLIPLGAEAASAAGKLVPTPIPQEPGTTTQDGDIHRIETPVSATRPGGFPAPNTADLTPLTLALKNVARLKSAPRPFVAAPTSATRTAPAKPREEDDTPPPAKLETPAKVETKIFEVDHESPDEDVLAHAMMVILEGGIVALPTDTVYGLGVDATNAEAVRRLYEVKGHDAQRKSLSVLVHTPEMLDQLVKEVPPELEAVLERYWPGGLTVLFYKHPEVLASVSESNSIAIRIPNDHVPLRLMGMINRPLAVINAAVGENPAAVDAAQVIDRFSAKVECIIDAGPCRSAETSTVLSVLTEPFEILREGTVPARDLKKILGNKLRD